MSHVQVGPLQVAEVLHRWVREQALPGTGLDEDNFWAGAGWSGVAGLVIALLAVGLALALRLRARERAGAA